MKRINGYLDIEQYFKQQLKRKNLDLDMLEDKKIIKGEYGGSNCMFWFNYLGVDVLFKVYTTTFGAYSELISEALAKKLGLPSAQYDLGTFQGRKGVITYDFKNNEYEYLYVGKLLDTFINEKDIINTESEEDTYNEYYLRDYTDLIKNKLKNNFEDIWNALEYYLYNKTNYPKEIIPELVVKVMRQLTDYFSFELISGNYDMHLGNISIGFNKYKPDVLVAPLYDNGDMFKMSGENTYIQPNTPQFVLNRGNIVEGYTSAELLQEYLNISDEEFVNRFKCLINMIDENTLNEIYTYVEEKTSTFIPDDIKETYAKMFYDNLNELKKVLVEYEQKRSF